MKRIYFVWPAACSIACILFSQYCGAQDPVDVLDHYRLVPRASTLHQTEGFAGVNQRYLLTGGYDFRHSRRPDAMASFENAEIWGSIISDQPTPAFVIDVDEILNIEGLKGAGGCPLLVRWTCTNSAARRLTVRRSKRMPPYWAGGCTCAVSPNRRRIARTSSNTASTHSHDAARSPTSTMMAVLMPPTLLHSATPMASGEALERSVLPKGLD